MIFRKWMVTLKQQGERKDLKTSLTSQETTHTHTHTKYNKKHSQILRSDWNQAKKIEHKKTIECLQTKFHWILGKRKIKNYRHDFEKTISFSILFFLSFSLSRRMTWKRKKSKHTHLNTKNKYTCTNEGQFQLSARCV